MLSVHVCVAWAAFGSCLQGLDVVARAAEGPVLRGRRWRWLANFVAGAAFPAFGQDFSGCLGLDVAAVHLGCTFAWHGQRLVAV